MSNKTLYQTLQNLDNIFEEYKQLFDPTLPKTFPNVINQIIMENRNKLIEDSNRLQRTVLQSYEQNPILHDAIEGKLTVEESLQELAQIHKPIWRLFPKKKNKTHNERLDNAEKLVGHLDYLRTHGVFMPLDSFVGGIIWTAISLYGASLLASPENIPSLLPAAVTTLYLGPLIGFAAQLGRSGSLPSLPLDRAKYLDQKIDQFYR